MIYNVKISRLANLYFYITCVSEADKYYRPNYIPKFAEITGDLNNEEKSALDDYKKYYLENKSDEKIAMFFSDDELILDGKVKNIFKTMEPKFSKIWDIYSKELEKNKIVAKKIFKKNDSIISKCLDDIGKLFGKDKPNDINIYLIINPLENNNSGKSIDENTIELEIKDITEEKNAPFLILFLHELIHSHYEDDNYKKMIGEILISIKEKKIGRGEIREAIIKTITWGYQGEKYFGLNNEPEPVKKDVLDKTLKRRYIISNLKDMIHNYVDEKKKIDEELIKYVLKILRDYQEPVSN